MYVADFLILCLFGVIIMQFLLLINQVYRTIISAQERNPYVNIESMDDGGY
jgi:hypothetical protein